MLKKFGVLSLSFTFYFIRIYEELFNFNIFVFCIEPIANKLMIKLPRHTHSYISHYNTQRECVLLYENRGHVDIITHEVDGVTYTTFANSVGHWIHHTIHNQLYRRILVINDSQNVLIQDEKGVLIGQETVASAPVGIGAYYLNYNFLWEDRFPLGRVQRQMIDSKGKRYGVMLSTGRSNDPYIIIYHSPQPPLNAPLAEERDYSEYGSNDYRLGANLKPVGINSKGAWYSIFGIQRGFFVPLKVDAILRARTEIANLPFMEIPAMLPKPRMIGLGKRTQIVQSTSHTLKQVFIWLFRLAYPTGITSGRTSGIESKSVQDFIAKYIREDTRQTDDALRYDFSKLPMHPPVTTELKVAIQWLDDKNRNPGQS